jgi:hypothetical protein
MGSDQQGEGAEIMNAAEIASARSAGKEAAAGRVKGC